MAILTKPIRSVVETMDDVRVALIELTDNVRRGRRPFTTITAAAYTITLDDSVILCDATSNIVTVTLPPAAAAPNAQYDIVATNVTNNVVIEGDGAETISGSANVTLTTQWKGSTVFSDGTAWYLLGEA